jgi:hypothetical protein
MPINILDLDTIEERRKVIDRIHNGHRVGLKIFKETNKSKVAKMINQAYKDDYKIKWAMDNAIATHYIRFLDYETVQDAYELCVDFDKEEYILWKLMNGDKEDAC